MIPNKAIAPQNIAALAASLAAAFALCGYEFIRSTANTLFKAAYGAAGLPLAMACIPIAVWLILIIYGKLLSYLGPRRTLLVTTLASGLLMTAGWLGIRSGWGGAAPLLFIFKEAYIVLLIEQYWSFINSHLEADAAKKLNGPICGVASLGSITGGVLLYALAEQFGTAAMLLFAAAATIPAALVSDFGYAKAGEPQPKEPGERKGVLGLSEFRLHPMLVCLFLVVISSQVVATALDIRFQGILQDEIPDPDRQTAFSGAFFAWLNVAAAFLQFVGAPLLMRFLKLKAIYLFIPLIHMATCLALIFEPTLAAAGAAYLLFKAFDYSVFRASKEILYIPFSFDVRYRAKEVIDTFGYRLGKGGSSAIFVLFQQVGFVLTQAYSFIALSASLVWFALIFPLIKFRHR